MFWRIQAISGEIQLTGAQLVRQLSEAVVRAKKNDIDVLADSVLEYLEAHKALGRMKLADVLHLGILMGYFYKQFLENNRVSLEKPDEDPNMGRTGGEASSG